MTAKRLPAVPDDPFAKPGTPLRYIRKSPTEYVLYSIGSDGVDDGGKPILNLGKTGNAKRAVFVDSKGDLLHGINAY